MSTKNLAYGAISVALGTLILLLSLIIPTNTLAILGLASLIIPILLIKTNYKTAIFTYVVTSIISIFIIPTNYSVLYIAFFGNYCIVKALIERLNKLYLEFIIKIIYFNIIQLLLYFLLTMLFPINKNKYTIVIFIILNIAFIVYDIVLSNIISYISKRFNNILK